MVVHDSFSSKCSFSELKEFILLKKPERNKIGNLSVEDFKSSIVLLKVEQLKKKEDILNIFLKDERNVHCQLVLECIPKYEILVAYLEKYLRPGNLIAVYGACLFRTKPMLTIGFDLSSGDLEIFIMRKKDATSKKMRKSQEEFIKNLGSGNMRGGKSESPEIVDLHGETPAKDRAKKGRPDDSRISHRKDEHQAKSSSKNVEAVDNYEYVKLEDVLRMTENNKKTNGKINFFAVVTDVLEEAHPIRFDNKESYRAKVQTTMMIDDNSIAADCRLNFILDYYSHIESSLLPLKKGDVIRVHRAVISRRTADSIFLKVWEGFYVMLMKPDGSFECTAENPTVPAEARWQIVQDLHSWYRNKTGADLLPKVPPAKRKLLARDHYMSSPSSGEISVMVETDGALPLVKLSDIRSYGKYTLETQVTKVDPGRRCIFISDGTQCPLILRDPPRMGAHDFLNIRVLCPPGPDNVRRELLNQTVRISVNVLKENNATVFRMIGNANVIGDVKESPPTIRDYEPTDSVQLVIDKETGNDKRQSLNGVHQVENGAQLNKETVRSPKETMTNETVRDAVSAVTKPVQPTKETVPKGTEMAHGVEKGVESRVETPESLVEEIMPSRGKDVNEPRRLEIGTVAESEEVMEVVDVVESSAGCNVDTVRRVAETLGVEKLRADSSLRVNYVSETRTELSLRGQSGKNSICETGDQLDPSMLSDAQSMLKNVPTLDTTKMESPIKDIKSSDNNGVKRSTPRTLKVVVPRLDMEALERQRTPGGIVALDGELRQGKPLSLKKRPPVDLSRPTIRTPTSNRKLASNDDDDVIIRETDSDDSEILPVNRKGKKILRIESESTVSHVSSSPTQEVGGQPQTASEVSPASAFSQYESHPIPNSQFESHEPNDGTYDSHPLTRKRPKRRRQSPVPSSLKKKRPKSSTPSAARKRTRRSSCLDRIEEDYELSITSPISSLADPNEDFSEDGASPITPAATPRTRDSTKKAGRTPSSDIREHTQFTAHTPSTVKSGAKTPSGHMPRAQSNPITSAATRRTPGSIQKAGRTPSTDIREHTQFTTHTPSTKSSAKTSSGHIPRARSNGLSSEHSRRKLIFSSQEADELDQVFFSPILSDSDSDDEEMRNLEIMVRTLAKGLNEKYESREECLDKACSILEKKRNISEKKLSRVRRKISETGLEDSDGIGSFLAAEDRAESPYQSARSSPE